MIPVLAHIPAAFAAGVATTGMVQAALGLAGVRRFARMRKAASARGGPGTVTVLKPLHGAEPLLAAALESFFRQDYPVLQLVFGVQRADDPAITVVRDLCTRYPDVDATLVVDATPHGANCKIANLMNMLPAARHDVLLVSDSDMHVAPDYVRHVAAALRAPGVGLVTSLYIGKPATRGFSALLGSAYINQIFASGAVMARALGREDCLGATMAFTRGTLQRVGGFGALADYVADDGVLGRLVLASGQHIAMAPTVPATTVGESSLAALWRHELRWARSIRAMAPVAFRLSVVQFPIFWGVLAVLLAPGHVWPAVLLALAVGMRAGTGRLIEITLGAETTPLWLAPMRDMLSVAVMGASLFGEKVFWRGQILSTAPDRALVIRNDHRQGPPALAHGEG